MMKRHWLNTRFGIDFVAIGLVAVCVGVALVVFQDIWFVTTGSSPAMFLYDKGLSYLAASVATVFSVVSFFVFRPGLPKYVAVTLAISFASYVLQPLLPLHGYRPVETLCIARTVGLCSLLLLAREYLVYLNAGKAAAR
jgi:hypothetical protein